jgi:hypothetical protein
VLCCALLCSAVLCCALLCSAVLVRCACTRARSCVAMAKYCGLVPCRGIDDGEKDLPKELLEYLYKSIVGHEIKMLQGASAAAEKGTSCACAFLQLVFQCWPALSACESMPLARYVFR